MRASRSAPSRVRLAEPAREPSGEVGQLAEDLAPVGDAPAPPRPTASAARRSATRSVSEMSVSCPTAEIVGTRTAARARQTASLLNAARSSRPPPPRPTMQTSMPGIRFTSRSARASACTAPSPCTRALTTTIRQQGHRLPTTVMMSRSAAPAVLVTTASVDT